MPFPNLLPRNAISGSPRDRTRCRLHFDRLSVRQLRSIEAHSDAAAHNGKLGQQYHRSLLLRPRSACLAVSRPNGNPKGAPSQVKHQQSLHSEPVARHPDWRRPEISLSATPLAPAGALRQRARTRLDFRHLTTAGHGHPRTGDITAFVGSQQYVHRCELGRADSPRT
jgi:hypothetical protein